MMKLLMGPHGEIREFLIDYVENQLPIAKKFQFWFHLVLCKDCNSYLRRYNSSVKLSQNFLDDPPPEKLVHLTLKFLEERMPEDKKKGEEAPNPSP
ncbi:MAG: hypothetical protein IIC13_12300 [SAR324 cluster bacterium]|nr:hypothetical protein [SAR324 cluster bacterium]